MVRQHVLGGAYVEEGAHLMMSGTQEKKEGLEKESSLRHGSNDPISLHQALFLQDPVTSQYWYGPSLPHTSLENIQGPN